MVKIVGSEAALTGTALEEGTALNALRPGQSGTIVRVDAEPSLKMHLMELGFVVGSSITFLMSTPFGDPHIYRLRGTSIALRRSEAQCIRVKI